MISSACPPFYLKHLAFLSMCCIAHAQIDATKPKVLPLPVKTEKIGDSVELGLHDPESVGYWNAWIGTKQVVKERRIRKTVKFVFKGKPYIAFILDGGCGSPCYDSPCEIFSRISGNKVAEFTYEELIRVDAPGKETGQSNWVMSHLRVDWKHGIIFDPFSKKKYRMDLDSPIGFFPKDQLTHNF